jgi:hypothetical protein
MRPHRLLDIVEFKSANAMAANVRHIGAFILYHSMIQVDVKYVKNLINMQITRFLSKPTIMQQS